MKKIKTEKGITLVALIITIVVLLILAAVAIGTVRESDIIEHAQNAAGGYNQAKANELDMLTGYEETINQYVPGKVDSITVGDGVKYYYSESCDIEGVAAPAVLTVKDLEEGYKQWYIYAKQGEQYVFNGIEKWEYNSGIWENEDYTYGIITIKKGDLVSTAYDSNGPTIVGDRAYWFNIDKEYKWKFDLTSINDEIKNIIESAVYDENSIFRME